MTAAESTSGRDAELALRAGGQGMIFDAETAFLRRVRLGEREVVRGVYAAVRDHDWNTVPLDVTLVERSIETSSFRLVFDVIAADGPVDFRWRGRITGEPPGVVRYEMSGRAHSAFLQNRIGFCVLHPIDGFAGGACTVEHADGPDEEVRIPREIVPHQQVFDIRALTQVLDPDGKLEIQFAGDIFEMEDQRNWTDASFKTYCTPLDRLAPVQINEGDTVEQSVTILLDGNVERHAAPVAGASASTERIDLYVDETECGILSHPPRKSAEVRTPISRSSTGCGRLRT